MGRRSEQQEQKVEAITEAARAEQEGAQAGAALRVRDGALRKTAPPSN